MNNIINFSEIFCSTASKYHKLYKRNNGKIKKYNFQQRYLSLLNFINKESCWSKFNIDSETNKCINDNYLIGKYLNEIHNSFLKHGFYNKLYSELLLKYLQVTNFTTLDTISIDSTFVRNIFGVDLSRNKEYHNKPGLKVHVLVDSLQVPIAFLVSDSCVHDKVMVENLFSSKFISDDIFKTYCHNFLADTGYSAHDVNDFITRNGLNLIIGKNNQHVRKIENIQPADENTYNAYKKRATVENFFSHYHLRPCLINNYEKTLNSYKGLAMLYCSSYLCKKLNKHITLHANENLKKAEEIKKAEKKELQEKRKQVRKENKKKRKIKTEENAELLKQENKERIKKLHDIIWENTDKKIIDKKFRSSKYQYLKINKDKTKCRGRKKDLRKIKYKAHMKESLGKYVKDNILTKTMNYNFGKKELHIMVAPAYAFTEEIIKNKMKEADLNDIIKTISDKFFT